MRIRDGGVNGDDGQRTKGSKKTDCKFARNFSSHSSLLILLVCSLLIPNIKGLVTRHETRVLRGLPLKSFQQRIHTCYQPRKRTTPRFPTQQFAEAAANLDSDRALQNDKLTPKQLFQDFCFGANLVHSQYLKLLWKYSIVQSLYVTIPVAVILWVCRFWNPALGKNVYDLMYYPLYFIWNMSSGVATVLQLPLEALRWTFSSFPTIMIGLLEFLPNVMAVPLVQAVLLVRDTISWISMMASSNQVTSFLASVTAVLVWRPAVEELEYRSILNKFFFAPRVIQSKLRQRRSSSSDPAVEYIPLDNDAYMASSFSKREDDKIDTAPSNIKTSQGKNILLPLADESNRILMGSILFATTRLGWLSWDPVSGDHSSPYSWTIGFVQSIMAHFSGQMLPQVRPGLQIWVLLLAIYQTVGTFLVAQNVFADLYRERGLAASVGAHVTWTISKGTIPFRILWKVWLWCSSVSEMAAMVGSGSTVNQEAASATMRRKQG